MGNASTFHYSLGEEIANAITHGIAILLSIAGLAVLVGFACANGAGAKTVTAVSIYGLSMFLLYTASTLYHSIPISRAKRILQNLDHSMIYVLIAGSYTPFCLIPLFHHNGLWILIAEWSMAAFGIVFQRQLLKRSDWINCLIYLIMGWLIVIDVSPMLENSSSATLWFLVSGGLAYSLGIIFYVWEKLPYNHAIWHLFVLAGTVLQFFAVLQYVV